MPRSVRVAAAGRVAAAAALLLTTAATPARPQTPRGAPSAPSSAPPSAPAAAPPPADALGRTTPRGAVFGFLNAARKGDNAIARQYLNTRLPGEDAEALAHRVFVVLDARLPARLALVSDEPEGSRLNPAALNDEVIGTISTSSGPLAVTLERVTLPKIGPVWLFSRKTLEDIPAAYEDVTAESTRLFLPRYVTDWRVGGIRPFDWLVLIGGVILLYLATGALNRGLTAFAGWLARRAGRPAGARKSVLPLPARLLLIALLSRWLLVGLPLSLLLRQLLSGVTVLVTIAIVVWLGIVVNGEIERRVCRRIPAANVAATVSLVRVGRRLGDVIVVFLGLVAILRHFGVDPTPVVAGVGVGGLAVALAAQKTLENVIAGASLIFDQAVKIGDYLKVGTLEGTVDHIGLRSTRIRTLDRTVVTVPNSQIASVSLETMSARDKFWFHPIVSLRHETRAGQMQFVLDGLTRLLNDHPSVDRSSVRVRFLRMAAFSLDIEVFAYVYARDWPHFLEIQERLLFQVMETVTAAGAALAYPSQTLNLNGAAPLGAGAEPRAQR